MSGRIVVLSEEVSNQIAAGEVVERPASIVKELIENAIDAGATEVHVDLAKGGCQSIRITDNGGGIGREDAALVFERHATSKISRLDDIFHVRSFGFRGEAMASIASVARVEMLTRRPEDLEGTRAVVEAGAIQEIMPAGAPAGTQFSVTDLFANVPARRKFLKTEATEQSACLDAVTRLALAHPDVRLVVKADGREVFAAPLVQNVSERIAGIMGSDFSSHCQTVRSEKDGVLLQGHISRPDYTRSNSKSIYLFVNSRFIRDNSLTHAVLAAYRQVIEPRRYPAAVLFIDLPAEEVDVNVHPAKLEVRFKHSREIYELVSKAVALALAGAQTPADAFVYRLAPREASSASSGFWKPRNADVPSPRPPEIYSRRNLQQAMDDDWFARSNIVSGPPATVADSGREESITFANRTYLGQLENTYLVFGGSDGVMLLDQHAAHERIIIERLKAQSAGQAVSQRLLVPEVVNLSAGQIVLLENALPVLMEIGIELEIFGHDAVVVKAIPAVLPHIPPRDVMMDLADQLADERKKPSLADRKDKILAALACRAAIKANTPLKAEEVAALCHDLEQTPYNTTCPHGRPISVQFSLYEIERMFKRK